MASVTGKDRTKFRNHILKPLLDAGWLEMTIPEKPTSSKQKYRLTDQRPTTFVGVERERCLKTARGTKRWLHSVKLEIPPPHQPVAGPFDKLRDRLGFCDSPSRGE